MAQIARTPRPCFKKCITPEEPSAYQRVYEMVSTCLCIRNVVLNSCSLINLLPLAELQEVAIPQLYQFLAHQYPRIRADTAEYLYLVLSSKDIGVETDIVEEILLETEW